MKARVSEHQDVSPRTGKQVKGTLTKLIRDDMLNRDQTVSWGDLFIIGKESNHYWKKKRKPFH